MKQCSKCQETKPIHQFAPRSNTRHGTCQDCRKPNRTMCKIYYPNPESEVVSLTMSRITTKSAYHSRLGEEGKERDRAYSKRHYDKIGGVQSKLRTMSMDNKYIKKLLVQAGIDRSVITPELIDAKRNQLKLKKCLKQIKT